MSIWPFDDLHYIWLKNDVNWWNEEDWSNPQGSSRPPLFWRNNTFLDIMFEKEVKYDRGLEGALAKGSEVTNSCIYIYYYYY